MKGVSGLAIVASCLLAGQSAAQGNLAAADGGFFCALETKGSGSLRSETCELVFYPGDPAGYFARFAGVNLDIHGNPFRDEAVMIDGRPARRQRGETGCFAFEDGSGTFCVGP